MTQGGNQRRRTRHLQRDLGISYTAARRRPQVGQLVEVAWPTDEEFARLDELHRLGEECWEGRQPTIEDLLALSPDLGALFDEVRTVRDADSGRGRFCANRLWYGRLGEGGFRRRLIRAVGWGSSDIRVRSSKCYDVAYSALYNLLPDCRHGGGSLGCL